MNANQKKPRKPWSQEARANQSARKKAYWASRKAHKAGAGPAPIDREETLTGVPSLELPHFDQSIAGTVVLPLSADPSAVPSELSTPQSPVPTMAIPTDAVELAKGSPSSEELVPERVKADLEHGMEVRPPTEDRETPADPAASPAGAVPVLPEATAEGRKVDQPEVTPTPTEAEAAQILDQNQPSVSFGKPFSTTSFNLNYLIATGQVERVDLSRCMTVKEAAALKHEYVDSSLIHHNITRSTAGYENGELVVLWLAPELAKSPEDDITGAERAMKRMRWAKAEDSNRTALKASGGRELNFGWRHAFGKIVQFVPTIEQKLNYSGIHPLLNRLDGLFARALPQIWRDQLLDQQGTGFTKTATAESSFSGVTLLQNAPSSVHLDAKNSGYVVMTTAGQFTGGEFLLIEFGLSIPVARGSVLICATQKHWHCNFNDVRGTRYSILAFFTAALRGKTTGNGNAPVLPVTTKERRMSRKESDRPIEECGECHRMKPIHTHRKGFPMCQACNVRDYRQPANKESRGKLLKLAGAAITSLEQMAKVVGDTDHEQELESMQERIEEISIVGLGGRPPAEDVQAEDFGEANGEGSVETATEPAGGRGADEDAGNEYVIDIEEDGVPEEPIETATEVSEPALEPKASRQSGKPPEQKAAAKLVEVSEEVRQYLLVDQDFTPAEVNSVRVEPGLDRQAQVVEALKQLKQRS